jgi:hypothetical protein
MIFSGTSGRGEKHIELIFAGMKTQTRRPRGNFEVGKTYAIQPGRCKEADPRGRMKILHIGVENSYESGISSDDAWAEGQYSSTEYEILYEKMYPNWTRRWVLTFVVVP